MGPGEAPAGAVHVALVIGVGMVAAMVGHPGDRAPFGCAAAEGGQDVFQPSWPEGEAAVGQQPVIGQADADAAGQPVQDHADAQGRPGEVTRHERQECSDVQAADPEHGPPGKGGRPGRRRECRRHRNLRFREKRGAVGERPSASPERHPYAVRRGRPKVEVSSADPVAATAAHPSPSGPCSMQERGHPLGLFIV